MIRCEVCGLKIEEKEEEHIQINRRNMYGSVPSVLARVSIHLDCFESSAGDEWAKKLSGSTSGGKIKSKKKTKKKRLKKRLTRAYCASKNCYKLTSLGEKYCISHSCHVQNCKKIRYSNCIPFCRTHK